MSEELKMRDSLITVSHFAFSGGYMRAFTFYHIDEKYINYLHKIEPRVQFNKNEHRPYIGIVLSINSVDYYVPLESPKLNHKNIKAGGPVFKLDDGKLGIMGFNNMIPVLPSCLKEFNILEEQDEKYKMLLLNQLKFCEKNKLLIKNRAESVYNKTIKGNVPFYTQICCDFKKLERKCKRYNPKYKPHKK